MKVLRVIPSMNPSRGGPPQGIRNSIPALQALGVHNEVVSLDDPTAPFLDQDAFTVHALGAGISSWNYNDKLVSWLIDNLGRFDAVVIHGLWLYPSYAVWKSKRSLEKHIRKNAYVPIPKIFVMPHGMLDPYFQRTPGRKLKALRNRAYWKVIESRVVNDAEGLFFTCQKELQLARQPFRPYRPKQEVSVGYGIKAPPPYTLVMQQAFAEKCPEPKPPYLLYLSRIHPKKGVDLLIRAYKAVLDSHPERKVPQLVVAGPGIDSSYGQKLMQLTFEDFHLNHCVFFPGMLTGHAKWGAFYGCEAFVLPSHQENFGIAVVEAMACSKPVLISRQVNICQEIEQAGGGVVAEDTLAGTQQLLENWLNLSEPRKQAMGQKAIQLYQSHFAIGPAAVRFKKAIANSQINVNQ